MAFPDSDLTVVIKAYLGADPTAAVGTWPAATDLSSRLLDVPMQGTHGRNQGQSTAAASSFTLTLRNDDGALTPLEPTSPYYGTWDLGCPMSVEVNGVGASPPYGLMRGYIVNLEQTVVPVVGGGVVSAMKVTLGGVVRRLGQGSVEKSVMQRFVAANPPTSYWAMEEGFLASQMAPGVSGDPALTIYGYTSPITSLTGSGALAPWLRNGVLLPTGSFLAASRGNAQTTSWTMDWLYNIDAARGDKLSISFLMFDGLATATPGSTPNISVRMFGVSIGGANAGTVKIGFPNTNTAVASAALPNTAMQGNTLHHVRLQAVNAGGGTYTLSSWLDGVALVSATVTGTMTYGSPAMLVVDEVAGLAEHDGSAKVAVGYLNVWTGTPPVLATAVATANGLVGEAAHTRMARVCAEDNVPFSTTASTSRTCGPQPIGTLLAIVQDAELVDHGVLYELLTTWGFGYVAASQRYNAAATLTVDLSTYRTSDDGVSVVTPVRNDARLRNVWTVSMPDGGSATAADSTSIAKRGRYADSGDVNLASSSGLLNEALWRVHEGTYDGPRYRSFPIDLAANSASPSNLLTPWLAMSLGGRIDRTHNAAPAHPNMDTPVVLLGYSETIGHKSWKVDAVVEPFDPWHVGIWGNGTIVNDDTPRWDGSNSTTSGSFNTASLPASLTVATSSGNLWTTTGGHFPLKCVAAGVVLTVSAISGTSSPQTFTVTAASASKTIPSGSAVHIYRPVVYPLP